MPSLVGQMVKHLPTMQEIWVWSLGWEDPLEKEMATSSSTIAWKIPWTEEHGRLQSMGRKESDMTEHMHSNLTFSLEIISHQREAKCSDWRVMTHDLSRVMQWLFWLKHETQSPRNFQCIRLNKQSMIYKANIMPGWHTHSWGSDLLLSHGTAKSPIQLSTTFFFIMERDMKKNIYIYIHSYIHMHTHTYIYAWITSLYT